MAQIQFKGKTFVQNHHLLVKYHELVPVKGKSLTDKVSLQDNLIIHGDNLKALKALLPLYAGKVKCIYIDPPYNTGNELWRYNDNVNSPMMQDWLAKEVDREDLTRHDKWLCMMMPRLRLLKELLCDDGVIAVSIDDNEIHHLRILMDEVFDESNSRNIVVIRRGAKSVQAQFDCVDRLMYGGEYLLVYTRKVDHKFAQLEIELLESRAGTWNNHWRGSDRPSMRYTLFGITPKEGQWRWSENRSKTAIKNYEVLLREVGKTETTITQEETDEWWQNKFDDGEELDLLRLSNTLKPEHYVPPTDTKYASSLWTDLRPNGSAQLKEIFGKKVFDTPKSTDLVSRIIRLAEVGSGDVVLDSTAGSGTTAHSVLKLNAEDGKTRRFILVECENYAYSLTAERVRRVIGGVPKAKDEKLRKGLGGTFSYFELGKPVELEAILDGDGLPTYTELARYVFYTATGEEFDEKAVKPKTGFIGESRNYQVYLYYERDMGKLKELAFTLDMARRLPKLKEGKRRLVFAPTKYLDQEHLDEFRIDFAQLPFEIYELTR